MMLLPVISILAFLAIPLRVTACEGDCIVGTTNAMRNNYKAPVQCVVQTIGQEIIDRFGLVSQDSKTLSPDSLLAPVMKTYRNTSYSDLETNIFPGYFHGKCQDVDGVDPDGCPNPDCPVVCGTPGSIVHFYSIFCEIAHNTTAQSLASSVSPPSASYRALEDRVAAQMPQPRLGGPGPQNLRYRRSTVFPGDKPSVSPSFVPDLRNILDQIPIVLTDCCGGPGLPLCTWEKKMKALILSYP
ncbi:hypothetical protein C8R44DRAFT_702528 [Mycena epipterygia]|nr:hypothetical protein C8R44DRAFT_702528 [Mycena epipterygia]